MNSNESDSNQCAVWLSDVCMLCARFQMSLSVNKKINNKKISATSFQTLILLECPYMCLIRGSI